MSLAKKLIYPRNLKRVMLVLLLVVTVATICMGAVYDATMKKITFVHIDEVSDVNDEQSFSTKKETLKEFLTENQIVVGENDVLSKDINEVIADNDIIVMRKGRKIELSADGKVEFVITTKKTVGDALKETGVVLSQDDIVTPAKDTIISDGMSIVVDRVVKEEVTEAVEIPFATQKNDDKTLAKGKTKIQQKGVCGQKEKVYRITKKNGVVVNKEVLSEKVIKEPVNKIVLVGTKKVSGSNLASQSAVSKSDLSYKKVVNVTATAYSATLSENGGNSKTAIGLTPKFGIVAVDPRVIPLGSKLYIESADGGKSWVYGYCIAGDTGGAIKGNKIDLCFNTTRECINFGRRKATVYILNN